MKTETILTTPIWAQSILYPITWLLAIVSIILSIPIVLVLISNIIVLHLENKQNNLMKKDETSTFQKE